MGIIINKGDKRFKEIFNYYKNKLYKNKLHELKESLEYLIANKIEEVDFIPIQVLDSITKLYSNLKIFLDGE